MRRMAGMALRRMNASAIGNCEFVASVWRPWVKRGEGILNGVDGPVAPEPGFGHAVACIGRIAPEKGQLEFLSAVERIHAEIPAARCVIYGAALFTEAGAER